MILEPRLREINFGHWEGLPFEEIQAGYAQDLEQRRKNPFHTAASGREAPVDVAIRLLNALDHICRRRPRQSVILVSHGVSLAVLLCLAQGLPVKSVYEQVPKNASPRKVVWKPENR